MTVNSQSLTATTGQQPVQLPTQKGKGGPAIYKYKFYGNFTGCMVGAFWSFVFDLTFTDPAGNILRFVWQSDDFRMVILP